ncbi:ornithine cyclodeaminase family protein [Mesorhizobium sp. M6A.T.Cr.TU.016.01.1.1]|nr:ornithine cyclodeaminase family protein [Mesorhizobium sp. M6A.T.Cr.TU.016.01.1.1]
MVTLDLLPFDSLIPALRDTFVSGCITPTRHHHSIEVIGEADGTLLLMPAWTKSNASRAYAGVKLVNVFPGNFARGEPTVNSNYILYDGKTGRQLAVIDGDAITVRRTVAVVALAADYLARPDASKLLIIGAGRVARLLADAYRSVRTIDRIEIWDVEHAYAEDLAGKLAMRGLNATVADDLEAAVRRADIIGAATLATSPLIKGGWLTDGTHVDLIGGFTPDMREADDVAIRRASVFIDTMDAFREAGDLVQPCATGAFSEQALRGTLENLCRGDVLGRQSNHEITLFKTVGTALADLAAARLVYESASEASAF